MVFPKTFVLTLSVRDDYYFDQFRSWFNGGSVLMLIVQDKAKHENEHENKNENERYDPLDNFH